MNRDALIAEVADVIVAHDYDNDTPHNVANGTRCACGAKLGDAYHWRDLYTHQAAAVLDHLHPVIETAEELDALPVGSVVLSGEYRNSEDGMPVAFQKWRDGAWHRGCRNGETHPDNFLPATLLYRGQPVKPLVLTVYPRPVHYSHNLGEWQYGCPACMGPGRRDKRLTDTELAAEYWRASSAAWAAEYVDDRENEAELTRRIETLHRFATLPHYDERPDDE